LLTKRDLMCVSRHRRIKTVQNSLKLM